MAPKVTTETVEIIAALDVLLAADPIQATVAGTIRDELARRSAAAWCCVGSDPHCVAVRSDPAFPLLILGPWSTDELAELAAQFAGLPGLTGVAASVEMIELLSPELPPIARWVNQRLFRLDDLSVPVGVPGRARLATAEDRALLIEYVAAFSAEAGTPGDSPADAVDAALTIGRPWLWCDEAGAVVSMAHRRAAVAGSARVGPVYTPPAERGHGYASAVTAAATRDVLADSATPVLFTDLANPISNAIYPRLGYYPVADEIRVFFA